MNQPIPQSPHTPPAANEDQQRSISERISDAQDRIAERTAPARTRAGETAQAAAGSVRQFANDHPLLTVAGGLAAGALIALALPGRPGRKVRGSVLAAAGLVGELAANYGSKMLAMAEDAAQASQEKLGEIGDSFAEAAGTAKDSIADAGDAVIRQGQSIASRARR